MTEKYIVWIESQAMRDATLLQLALIALALVAAWELLHAAPSALAVRLRPLYLLGGLLLFLSGIVITYFTTGGQP